MRFRIQCALVIRLKARKVGSTFPHMSLEIFYNSILTLLAYFTVVLLARGMVVTTYISDKGSGLLDVGQRRRQGRE